MADCHATLVKRNISITPTKDQWDDSLKPAKLASARQCRGCGQQP